MADFTNVRFGIITLASQIKGTNPAVIHVGGVYFDLGATITGPQADVNFGIMTILNGALVSNIVFDTLAVATDTIDDVVTDQQSPTATSTRTVLIRRTATPHYDSLGTFDVVDSALR